MYRTIPIETIENAKDKTLTEDFEEIIDGIGCVTPIKSNLTIQSLGEFIQVKGNVQGIVKLKCDRCLENFDYKLDFNIDEMFAKTALLRDYSEETELKEGQFVTDLNGCGNIDIYDLLYQSVILNLPNHKVCGINCKGKDFPTEENISDPRMDVFKNIRIQPKNK